MNKLLLLLILYSSTLMSKELGVQGPTYNIKEQDALEWIGWRLKEMDKSGEIQRHQEKLKKQALHSVRYPKPVQDIQKTVTPRIYEKDLSFVVPYDITDSKGNIIKKAGEIIYPTINTKKALIFIDGTDSSQITWALKQPAPVKLVLIKGSAIELMEQYQTQFYFDQGGKLVHHFKIKQVPAIVKQKEDKLIISEVKI